MQCYNDQSPSPILKLLLKCHVEGYTRIPDGDTALHYAAHMVDVEIVHLLLAKGASVLVRMRMGLSRCIMPRVW